MVLNSQMAYKMLVRLQSRAHKHGNMLMKWFDIHDRRNLSKIKIWLKKLTDILDEKCGKKWANI